MMKQILLAVLPLLCMGCLFGSSRMMKPGATVASVDSRIITVAQFDSTVNHLQKNFDPLTSFDFIKTAALDSLIVHQLIQIRRDSIKQELSNDWDFNQQKLENVTQTIFKVLFEKQITGQIHIDTSEVTKYYQANRDKYIEQEKVKARHILIRRPKPDTIGVASEKKRQELIDEADRFARDRADGVLKKALAGENWDSLAAAYSEDANNSKKGGDLDYFYRGRMMPEFDSAAFAAAPGSIVGPIATRHGYHVIKVEEHLQPTPRQLDPDLGAEIFNEMLSNRERELSNAFVDSLKRAGVVAYNEEQLALPDSLMGDRAWVMMVNSTDTIFGATARESLPRYMRWKKLDSLTVTDKKEMLEMLSTTYLLRSAARTLGYMNDPEVLSAIGDVTNVEANLRISHLVSDIEYDPTEVEIAAFFNAHIDDYIEKRPLQVHHILFQDSLFAAAIRDSVVAGADFTEMAKRYYPGDPDIREVLYNLDYIGPEEMGHNFYDVAETLQVGSISHPVKTNWGYHLIKLVNRKQDKTLAQVRPGVRQRLKDARNAEKTSRLIADWKKGATIVVHKQVIDKIQPEEKKVIRIDARASEQKGS
jgi:parvulin-like peptidyl-prolyl isomerase